MNQILLCAMMTCLLLLSGAGALFAHSPHDVITDVQTGNAGGQSIVFSIVADEYLLRSVDQGASWKAIVQGLDVKHPLTGVAFAANFKHTKTLYVCSDGDGVYRSEDAGISWQKADQGLGSLRIRKVFSFGGRPKGVVFALGAQGGLFRSVDQGRSWRTVVSDNGIFTAMAFMGSGDEGTLLAADRDGRIHSSADMGISWELLHRLDGSGGIHCLAAASRPPDGQGVILAGTDQRGLLMSRDRGRTFDQVDIAASNPSVRSILLSPSFPADGTAFAAFWDDAVYKTADGGRTWQKHATGLTKAEQANTPLYLAPQFISLAREASGAGTCNLYLGGFDGLFKSEDGGKTWLQLETLPVSRIVDLAVSPPCTDGFEIALTTYGGGAYLMHYPDGPWEILNRGLGATRLTGLCFSPQYCSDAAIFSGHLGHLLRYDQPLRKWVAFSAYPDGFPGFTRKLFRFLAARGVPETFLFHFFPEGHARVLYPHMILASPNFAADRTLFYTTRRNGILRHSFHRHRNAVLTGGGLPSALVASPGYADDHTLFRAERGRGVFRSTDSGAHWEAVNQGLLFLEKWRRVFEDDRQREELETSLYYAIRLAISPDYGQDRTLLAFCGEGGFQTQDSGESWACIQLPGLAPDHPVLAAAFSPDFANDQTLLISAKGHGLFQSEDGGRTFSALGQTLISENHDIVRIDFSPFYAGDHTLFAVSDERLFVSRDRGRSWRPLHRPIRYENHRDVVACAGRWDLVKGDGYSAASASLGRDPDSRVVFRFFGTGIKWIGGKSPGLAEADVFIDGIFRGRVNQYSATPEYETVCFALTGLEEGRHVLEIRRAEHKAGDPAARGILVDAFDVTNERI